MSGTNSTANRLAGIATMTVDGDPWDVVSDLSWNVSPVKRETLAGQTRVEGYSEMPLAPHISATLRDQGATALATLIAKTNSEVQVLQANGKTVSGYGMWCTELGDVRTQEGSFAVRFEGPVVTETPT